MPSYSIILSSVTAFVGSCPSRYAFSAYVNASHTIDFLFLNCRSIFFPEFYFYHHNLSPLSVSPTNIYLFKFSKRNTRKWWEIYSKLTIKTPERRHCRSGIYIVNFDHISHLFLVFLFLTLSNKKILGGKYLHLSRSLFLIK